MIHSSLFPDAARISERRSGNRRNEHCRACVLHGKSSFLKRANTSKKQNAPCGHQYTTRDPAIHFPSPHLEQRVLRDAQRSARFQEVGDVFHLFERHPRLVHPSHGSRLDRVHQLQRQGLKNFGGVYGQEWVSKQKGPNRTRRERLYLVVPGLKGVFWVFVVPSVFSKQLSLIASPVPCRG